MATRECERARDGHKRRCVHERVRTDGRRPLAASLPPFCSVHRTFFRCSHTSNRASFMVWLKSMLATLP